MSTLNLVQIGFLTRLIRLHLANFRHMGLRIAYESYQVNTHSLNHSTVIKTA